MAVLRDTGTHRLRVFFLIPLVAQRWHGNTGTNTKATGYNGANKRPLPTRRAPSPAEQAAYVDLNPAHRPSHAKQYVHQEGYAIDP